MATSPETQMTNDNHAEAIAAEESEKSLTFTGAFITGITLLAYHATNTHVIKTCDLGSIFYAHCCVYATGFVLGALQLALFFMFDKRVHTVRLAISTVMLAIFIFGSIALQSHAAYHRQRVFHERPACKYMFKDSALAFHWYTYAVLDLLACVSSCLVLVALAFECQRTPDE